MSRDLDVRLPRTRALLLGFLLAAAVWAPPPARAEADIDVLLEASMRSSFLQDFQDGIRATDAVATREARQNAAAPTAFPDTSAAVGRIFRMKVPNKMEDVYLGDVIKVSPGRQVGLRPSEVRRYGDRRPNKIRLFPPVRPLLAGCSSPSPSMLADGSRFGSSRR